MAECDRPAIGHGMKLNIGHGALHAQAQRAMQSPVDYSIAAEDFLYGKTEDVRDLESER